MECSEARPILSEIAPDIRFAISKGVDWKMMEVDLPSDPKKAQEVRISINQGVIMPMTAAREHASTCNACFGLYAIEHLKRGTESHWYSYHIV